jgi:hypothetical protein
VTAPFWKSYDRIPVSPDVRNDNRTARPVKLIATSGPLNMDDPQPAITTRFSLPFCKCFRTLSSMASDAKNLPGFRTVANPWKLSNTLNRGTLASYLHR